MKFSFHITYIIQLVQSFLSTIGIYILKRIPCITRSYSTILRVSDSYTYLSHRLIIIIVTFCFVQLLIRKSFSANFLILEIETLPVPLVMVQYGHFSGNRSSVYLLMSIQFFFIYLTQSLYNSIMLQNGCQSGFTIYYPMLKYALLFLIVFLQTVTYYQHLVYSYIHIYYGLVCCNQHQAF